MKIKADENINIKYRVTETAGDGRWLHIHTVNIEKDDLPKILHLELEEIDNNAYATALASLSGSTNPPKPNITKTYKIRIENYMFSFTEPASAEAYYNYFLGSMEKSFKDTYPEFAL